MNITDTPVKSPAQIQADLFDRLYHYIPKQEPAIVACVMLGILTIAVSAMTIRYKGHYMWIIAVSCLLEAVGYAIRIVSVHKTTIGIFVGSSILLIVMPIAMAFVNYLVFGRILKKYGRKILFLKPKWIAGIFLVSDVLSFLLQGGAAGLLVSTSKSMQSAGRNIIIAGFVIQLVFFACFIWLTIHATFVSPRFKLFRVKSLHFTFYGLWITIGLIFIRNLYRAVDYISPKTSYVVKNEWCFYVFEFAPITISFIFYCIFHFGRFLPADGEWVKDVKAHKSEIKRGEDPNEVQMAEAPTAPSDDQV